ncbi:MAG: hypothetical protein PHI88_02870 [Candidatus Pacebacteria bacterium]|nr:hypothetical protein [Candidatus Paceibacterota bacterium]
MRSLERRFNNIADKNPFWSSYICFSKAIDGQKFSKQIISRYFNKLVSKEDYNRSDKREILRQLFELSKIGMNLDGKRENQLKDKIPVKTGKNKS